MLKSQSFRAGLRDSILILLAVGGFGVAYGVLAVSAGFSPWLATFSSLVIVSGAAQFTMIGLLSAGAVPILIAVTGLGLRHLPMSASLANIIGPQTLWRRLRLAWILVDETFGLTIRAVGTGIDDVVAYKSAADLMLYTGWIIGTAVGAWFGGAIEPGAIGIGVLFSLLFLGLAVPMIRTRRDWIVAASAVLATILSILMVPAAWQITVAAVAASLAGMVFDE
ncbi:MAG: AzlC family ABC transporter permease [Acidimicrobiia bacterium]